MISPLAGQPAPQAALIDASRLISAYFQQRPDPVVPAQRVAFGTSGHRGSAFERSFNEWHVLAITQAVCDHRRAHGISGPLFLGIDTHALSAPACASACEVLAANGVELMLAAGEEYTPTPAISHAILAHNHDRFPMRTAGLADGIVITPSHNPPGDGGFKYNPPHGGPAGLATSRWIEAAANRYLETGLAGVRRMTLAAALRAPSTHRHDYRSAYVADLGQVIDMEAIRHAGLHLGVDPLGGAGVHYWAAIAERYGLDLSVLSEDVDPTFRFMTLDWDGQIRLDPASPYAMQRLIACKNHFDLAFACDTDHDRHGIVTPADGLLAPNHYLCVAIDYLFRHRPHWSAQLAIGKTVVSTQLIDRVAARLGRKIFETPVGFKWFASGLLAGSLGFAGEESAGASFLRREGSVWTTDKDGIAAALLAAEITAVTGEDPGAHYAHLTRQLGQPMARQTAAAATPRQKQQLAALSPAQISLSALAGERIESILTHAPGNGAAIGGIKLGTTSGWCAARPSGTEHLYKIYAESFQSAGQAQRMLAEAQQMIDAVIDR
ncbi:MAG: hypothetical protein RI925_1303 [Pseudomonadota bacterium]